MSTGGSGRFTRAGHVICSACQAENPAGNRFCDRCGTRIGVSTRPPLVKPDAAPAINPSPPRGEDAPPSPSNPLEEATSVTNSPPSPAAPTDDAAPTLIDLAPVPAPRPGGASHTTTDAGAPEAGAITATSLPAAEVPVARPTPPRPSDSGPGTTGGPATRGPRPAGVPANDGTGVDSLAARGATAGSTRPLVILLGITGALVALCVALWVLLVFLGAINFTLRGASLATAVATIVATRVP